MSRKRRNKKAQKEQGLLTTEKGEIPTVVFQAETKKIEPEEPLSKKEIGEIIQARIREQDEVILPQRRREGVVTKEWRQYAERRRV